MVDVGLGHTLRSPGGPFGRGAKARRPCSSSSSSPPLTSAMTLPIGALSSFLVPGSLSLALGQKSAILTARVPPRCLTTT